MSTFKVHKVVASLPTQLQPDAAYAVRVGLGFDLYITDSTGAIAHKVNGATSQLPEYIDSGPNNPIVGQQWIRLDTQAPAFSPTHLAPLGLLLNRSTVRYRGSVKTQTSFGVIE